jgi:hypothetical protein
MIDFLRPPDRYVFDAGRAQEFESLTLVLNGNNPRFS